MRGSGTPAAPDPAELPHFAPVVDSDEGGRGRLTPPGDIDFDRGLLRGIGVIVVLGIIIGVLMLPPISILDRNGAAAGVVASERDVLPDLPEGLVALSPFYDLEIATTLPPPYYIQVQLAERTTDGANLALYSYSDDDGWRRLVAASLDGDGLAAEADVNEIPGTVIVMRRVAFARGLGLIVAAGEVPDRAATGAGIVSVIAGGPATDAEDLAALTYDSAALDASRPIVRADLYLGLSAPAGPAADAVDVLLGTPALSGDHAQRIVEAAIAVDAAGVHLDYPAVDPARRAEFSAFVQTLADALAAEQLGLVVSVPTPAGADTGAYDWQALAAAADVLWLRAPSDPGGYHQQLETALEARRNEGVDLGNVWLVVDRRSHERSPEGVEALSLYDALTRASSLRAGVESGIAPGDAVTIAGVNIDRAGGNNSGLLWDEAASAVAFSYVDRGGPRTVWIENRFSLAFRLDLARRLGLGGVVVEPAAEDESLPAFWNTLARFVEDGSVRLELPYGPYLAPRWQASAGAIEGGEQGVAVWRAPAQVGVYDVSLVVSDGVVFLGQQISLRVANDQQEPAPTPAPIVTPPSTATPAPSPPAPAPAATEPPPVPTATATPQPAPQATPTPSTAPGPAGN